MKVVVDTNVAIAANGRDTHASFDCQYMCTEFLEELVSPGNQTNIVLDEMGLIYDEYSNYLYHRGQPGVGDAFFKYLHDHMYLGKKILLVQISPIADETRSFNELQPNTVDRSDRKFLATAVVASAEIVNATDTDWHEQTEFLADLDIHVRQLCPEHGCV